MKERIAGSELYVYPGLGHAAYGRSQGFQSASISLFERDSSMTTIEGTPWESLSYEEKNRVLYERQKQMLVEILDCDQ